MPAEKRDAATVTPRGPWTISAHDDNLLATLPLNMTQYREDHYALSVHDFLHDLPPEFGPAPTLIVHEANAVVQHRLTLVDYQDQFLKRLRNDDQRYVVIHRYGLRGNERRKRQDIADDLGVCPQRVAQIEHFACRLMYHMAQSVQRYAQEISDE
jgi:hypothetical protein